MNIYKEFGRDKAGYSRNKLILPKTGNLLLDGIVLLNDLPFPILQAKRRELLRKGYLKRQIKISYNTDH